MNTPAHAIASLLIVGRRGKPETAMPLAVGAVLPDLPMLVFYAYEALIRRRSEEWIWSEGYHDPVWQGVFDLFNSIPLIAIGLLVAHRIGAGRLMALFASMAVHVLGDLPLHNGDAHRHFFPLSNWRFESPVSYWDPQHYGLVVAPLETLLVIVGSAFLMWRYRSRRARILLGLLAASYALYWAYVFWVWV